jgi:hypothetical protein
VRVQGVLANIEIAHCLAPGRAPRRGAPESEVVQHTIHKARHSALKARFPSQAIAKFPQRLAYTLMCQSHPDRREITSLRDAEVIPDSLVSEYLCTGSSTAGVKIVHLFEELKWAIAGNPGTLKLRAHETYRGKKRNTACVVRSPNG